MPGHPRPGLRGNINFETCPTYESDRVPALKFLTENETKKSPVKTTGLEFYLNRVLVNRTD